jgi:hypothetical protein
VSLGLTIPKLPLRLLLTGAQRGKQMTLLPSHLVLIR